MPLDDTTRAFPPPNTIQPNPDYVPLYVIEPARWMYDLDPGNGISRASYAGAVYAGGTAAGNKVATMADIAASTTGVASFNARTGTVVLTTADVTAAGAAPLASPAFSGIPAAPTPPAGSNSGQIATTYYVDRAVTMLGAASVGSFNGRTGAVVLTTGDVTGAGGAPSASPTLTGTPTSPTATAGTASGQIATTQFVANAIAGSTVVSWNGRQGVVALQLSDVTTVGGAPSVSPGFTGTPTAPTKAPGDSTTALATTAFVTNALTSATAGVASFNTRTGAVTLLPSDLTAAGGAPIVSPAFTGTPAGPTATAGTATTQLATTAFVANAITALPGVASFNGRQGTVTLQLADVTSVGGAPLASPALSGTPNTTTPPPGDNSTRIASTAFVTTAFAPIASPTFTGTPAAPTPAALDSSTKLATTAFVTNANASTQQAAFQNTGRNLVHNGLFNVAQRGVGPWNTSEYTSDRWLIVPSLDAMIVNHVALSDADRAGIGDEAAANCFSCNFTGNAGAAAFSVLQQHVEDVRRLAGKTIIVSFFAVAGAAGIRLGVSQDQNFGTGGAPSALVSGAGQAVTLTTGWARYALTFTLPSIAGRTLGTNSDNRTTLNIWYSSGTDTAVRAGNIGVQSGLVNLWGVQLEIAQPGQTQPTPLEKPDAQQELAKCQRFYFQESIAFLGNCGGVGSIGSLAAFPVWMRAIPTINIIAGPGYYNADDLTVYFESSNYIFFRAQTLAAGDGGVSFEFSASADL
jgi:hypothetical protein